MVEGRIRIISDCGGITESFQAADYRPAGPGINAI